MTSPTPQADRTGHPSFRSVLVPLDGSTFGSEALRTASVLAQRFTVPLEAVTVARGETWVEDPDAHAQLEDSGARLRVVTGDDPADAILRLTEVLAPYLVCMSTHGHGRIAGTFLGSVARDILHRSAAPIVVIGPSARPSSAGPAWAAPLSVPRIVACVDGTEASEAILPTAAAWATTLEMALTILIVAEPAPMSPVPTTTASTRVGHLTANDAVTYVTHLAEQWTDRAPEVTGEVALDPISPASGVEAYLRDTPAGLLAVSSHARGGLNSLWSGATASGIIHASPIPVLVVPIDS